MAFVSRKGTSPYINLRESLDAFAKEYIEELGRQIILADKVATSKLLKTLDYRLVEKVGGLFEVVILAQDYMKWVNDGRKPGKMPPIAPLMKWVRIKGIRFTKKNGRGFLTTKQTAFVIAKSLSSKSNGGGGKFLRATNVIQISKNNILKKKDLIIEGAKADFTNLINETFEDIRKNLQ
jgi:hypothetical protein